MMWKGKHSEGSIDPVVEDIAKDRIRRYTLQVELNVGKNALLEGNPC